MILDRPWVYKMRNVPSTYHQLIKYSTMDWVKINKRKEMKGEELQFFHEKCITFWVKVVIKGWTALKLKYYSLYEKLSHNNGTQRL